MSRYGGSEHHVGQEKCLNDRPASLMLDTVERHSAAKEIEYVPLAYPN